MEKQEDLKKQVADIQAKLQAQDEATRKTMESTFREKMGKDTAGTVMEMFQTIQTQIIALGQTIDVANPLLPAMRALNERLARIENWIASLKPAGEKSG